MQKPLNYPNAASKSIFDVLCWLTLLFLWQWWPFHEHCREDPSSWWLHHRLHHRVSSWGPFDPKQLVPFSLGEPATGVQIRSTQTGEEVDTGTFDTGSVKCSIIVLTQCLIFIVFIFNLDYIELWNVWKQEEYHQHERGFLCWGGLIQVRQVLNTLDHI